MEIPTIFYDAILCNLYQNPTGIVTQDTATRSHHGTFKEIALGAAADLKTLKVIPLNSF